MEFRPQIGQIIFFLGGGGPVKDRKYVNGFESFYK